MTLLSREEFERLLPEGWRVEDNYLVRDVEFKTYMDGINFINELARIAEAEEHHPDIIIVWKHITLRLTTHDEGGITELDIRMANLINELIDKWRDRIEEA
ncbi:MAG: 4a-hydroxytetrahydrobiopterin dehydratase [Vulcanisaeta sp. AZ3]|jgi:4a-hydroxytetrahydrobiopterin dehydratase